MARESSFPQQSSLFADLARGCLLHAADFSGAGVWVVGCALFLPSVSSDPSRYLWACICFIIGEWLYIGLGIYFFSVAAGIIEKFEAIGCILGGTSFFWGTVLFLPQRLYAPSAIQADVGFMKHAASGMGGELLNLPGNAEDTYETPALAFSGFMLFVIGSLGFSFSSFFNAMGLRSFGSRSDQLAAVSSALHLGGGLFFCLGSMGFAPQVGCGNQMVAMGSWFYICGCILYMSGACVAIAREIHVYRSSQGDKQVSDDSSESQSDEDMSSLEEQKGFEMLTAPMQQPSSLLARKVGA